MSARSLEDFRREHDPTYRIENPSTIFSRDLKKNCKVFIITAAQNATPVNPDWWAILQKIAEHRKAEILVVPIRYKNPTSHWSGSQQNAEHWDALVRPYLWNVRLPLNKNIAVLADIKVQPTAASPLTGADAVTSDMSAVLGHTKVQMKSIPVPSSIMAKLTATTGACTEPNYTDSRAGKLGEFHHSYSAVVVELDGERFNLRHLHYSTEKKRCIDLNVMYTAKSVWWAPPAEALVMGDTHVDYIDPKVAEATFGKAGIIAQCDPKHLVWHDLLDGYSINPHHGNNPFNRVAKRRASRDNVLEEIKRAVHFVVKHSKARKSVIVPSNHNDFLLRWILGADWKLDPVNAECYLTTALDMVQATQMSSKGTEFPDPFGLWFRRLAGDNAAKILSRDESFKLAGVELGMHGDRGPNGARGSIMNHRRLGVKTIIGHSHTPGIEEGCYQVGTSTHLRLEYNSGASGWLNTHCLLNADGKRQLIHIIEGKYRT
jgi:hypothetical protein